MDSIRQQKVNSLLKKELSIIFQEESRNLLGGKFITVTQVRVSPDLGLAKVYLSFMAEKEINAALELVKSAGWQIRKNLGSKIGKQVRVIPELHFYIDDSLDYFEEIDRLLKK
jgi:ribosome-binding factor A